jgi:hypothetical protein
MRNRHLYPDNWDKISLAVRQRSNWQCEVCCKPCRQPGESLEAFASRAGLSSESILNPQRWCLTVAHLNHQPSDCSSENLKAMCAPCHLRYDAQHHANSRRVNQRKLLEAQGQLLLF